MTTDPDWTPEPPTFWNRLSCRVRGHMFVVTQLDYTPPTVHLICLGCSRTHIRTLPTATLALDSIFDIEQIQG